MNERSLSNDLTGWIITQSKGFTKTGINGSELKNEVTKLVEKHSVEIGRTTTKYKHTHTAFVEAFNKELAKLLFKPMDAEELQDPEEISTIWVKNLNKAMNKMNNTESGMLKRPVRLADDDEFDHIVKNSQTVLRLNDQYENHPCVEEFTKKCNVMFVYRTYVLEEEADAKFSLDDIWNLFQKDPLPSNNFCRQIINCMKMSDDLQKTLDLPLNTEFIRQAHKIMMQDEKDVSVGEYRKSPVFAGYHIFVPASLIERYMEEAIFRFHETKQNDLIWLLQICLEKL